MRFVSSQYYSIYTECRYFLYALTPHSQLSTCVSIGSKALTPHKSRGPQEDGERSPICSDPTSPTKGDSTWTTANQKMGKLNTDVTFKQSQPLMSCYSCVLTNKYILALVLCQCSVPVKQLLLQQGSRNRNHTPLSSQTDVQSREITGKSEEKNPTKQNTTTKLNKPHFMQMQSVEFNATGHQQTEILQIVPLLTQHVSKS